MADIEKAVPELPKEKKPTKKEISEPKKKRAVPKMSERDLLPKTNFKGLPKISKTMLKEIKKLPIMDDEEIQQYLTAIALGLVEDKFGFEASLDTKLKAIAELNKMKQANSETNSNEESVMIVDDIESAATSNEDNNQ